MESFSPLHTANADYIEEAYERYQRDPDSVPESWQQFFAGYDFAFLHRNGEAAGASETEYRNVGDKEVSVMKLINAYRTRSHLLARTNPIKERRFFKADLELEYFGLSDADLDTVFETGRQVHIGPATLRRIIEHLRQTYCSSIGIEYRHIQDSAIRIWLHETMEPIGNLPVYDKSERRRILTKLAEAVIFEKFLHVKYAGQKRFSLEGCEALIPALDVIFREGTEQGAEEFVLGMAHRGRLNVLVNCFGKSYEAMFSEFEGSLLPDYVHVMVM